MNTVTTEFSHNPSDVSDHGFKKDTTQHYTFTLDAEGIGSGSNETGKKTSEIVKVGLDEQGKPIKTTTQTSSITSTEKWEGPLAGAKFKLYTDANCTNEYVPKKALPPFGWKLVGWVSVFLAAFASLLLGLWKLVKFIASKIKEHRMSPIERARLELERLLQKDLPSLGKFKDFYVELTLVVRRYVQRKYGVRAPNMTTEEFLRETKIPKSESLEKFLQSADMVKFAGISATREMADTAVGATKDYIETDNARVEETK
jgi:hypothetical protein